MPIQRERIMAQAIALGTTVAVEFVDAGKSATTMNRDGLQALLAYVLAERPSYVIVYKLDRLARNLADGIEIRKTIREARVRLVSCCEPIDDWTPSGRMVLNTLDNMSEFYSANLSEEMKNKLIGKVKAGGTIGKAPPGYLNAIKRIDGIEHRYVEVDDKRGPLLQWVWEAFGTGEWSLSGIAEAAQAKGLTTVPTAKMAEKPMPRSTLARLLRNPYYVGVIRWRGSATPATTHRWSHKRLLMPCRRSWMLAMWPATSHKSIATI